MSFDSTPRDLGARLRELRVRRGLSLRQAADLFAIPHVTLWRWERGEGLAAAALCEGVFEALSADSASAVPKMKHFGKNA